MLIKISLQNIFNINNILIYTIFLFIGLNIKIFSGLYIYNILIVLYLIFNIKNITLSKNLLYVTVVFFIINIIPIILQLFIYNNDLSISAVYVLYNYFILISFILFIKQIKFARLNYNIILILLSIPIIISIIMFFNYSIETYFLNLFHLEKYPSFGRYGGIFGRDVNALGLYSSLILLFSIILYKLRLVSIYITVVIIFISLLTIFLSGMRTGLLVFFVGLVLFNKKLKIINYWYSIIYIVIFIFIILNIYNSNDTIKEIIDFIIDRFSLSTLLESADLKASEASNVKTAINYFYRVIDNHEFNLLEILFGMDFNLVYVDNLYIFLYLKYGFLYVLFSIFIGIYLLYITIINKNTIMQYFIITSFIIAIKGIFILNNFYMFLVVFIIYLWNNLNKGIKFI